MICQECRDTLHDLCVDLPRLYEISEGIIPAVRPGEGAWCACQHAAGSCLRPDRQADPRRGA